MSLRPRARRGWSAVAVGGAIAAATVAGCATDPTLEPVHVAETRACVHDPDRGGVRGSYVLQGRGDARVEILVVRQSPSRGGVLASRTSLVRDGDYEDGLDYFVPVDLAPSDVARVGDLVSCQVRVRPIP